MAAFEALSGMAGDIRTSITSEQFDLSGYTESRARDLMLTAFSAPLTAPTSMVRFTFVVGGGKLVRQKYNDDLPKWLTAALREIGFSEDRSAAETYDSQGTFKQQHDTGQNLKYLIVFPRVACSSATSEPAPAEAASVDVNTPEYIITAAQLSTFTEIINAKTQSWFQKKRALKVVQDAKEVYQQVEAKLISGAPLLPAEQLIYEANSGADDEKIAWLQAECKRMVDTGAITGSEKEEVLNQLAAHITATLEEITKANEEAKPKKVEKLQEKKTAQLERKAAIERVVPVIHRLKHSDEVQKLRVKLFAMAALEEKGRSMSLTMADLKILEEKSAIEEDVAALEEASRMWFETEAEFKARCDLDAREAKTKYNARVKTAAAKGKSGAGNQSKSAGASRPGSSGMTVGRSVVAGNSWSTVAKKPSGAGGGSSGGGGKKAGSSFAAAFGSDSD